MILDSPETPVNYNYAGFWMRFVAIFIDAILLNILTSVIGFLISVDMGYKSVLRISSISSTFFISIFTVLFVQLTIYWLYFALLESSAMQATIGKKAIGLQVTDMNGERINLGKATGRFFSKIISFFTLGIGFMMAAFTNKKQALHDIISNCLVVKQADRTY